MRAALLKCPPGWPRLSAETRVLALLQAPPAMARAVATPLLAAMLVLMLVAGSHAQGWGGFARNGPCPSLVQGPVTACLQGCARSCNIPVNRAPATSTLVAMVSVQGCHP